jgi:acyl-CoA synthetase (AMP-forming)/AMP-acid ligase II/acyl-CoA reductase-like NAD-dependent aldehyde dehydrogenase
MKEREPTFDVEKGLFKSPFADVKLPPADAALPKYVLDRPFFDPAGPDAARACVVDGLTGEVYRFGELRALVGTAAAALVARGFVRGDALCVALPNVREYAVAVFAALSLGGVVSAVNPLSTADEFDRYLSISGARWVVACADGFLRGMATLSSLLRSGRSAQLRGAFVVGDAPEWQLKGLVQPFGALLDATSAAAAKSAVAAAAATTTDATADATADNDNDDDAFLMFSSGTSGRPKGVRLSQRSVCANLAQLAAAETTAADDVVLAFLPFANAFGLLYCLVHSLARGATVVTAPRFNPEQVLGLVAKHRVTRMPAAPPVIAMLAVAPVVDRHDLSSLRKISCGGSRLEPQHARRCLQRWAAKGWTEMTIKQGFGMTELSPVMCINNGEEQTAAQLKQERKPRDESCGLLLPNTEVRVADLESGAALGPGEEGEIWVRGPQLMAGYRVAPGDDDAPAESPVDADGWFHTGDIGYLDALGYYFITDRLKELIKYKGYQVAPAELEQQVLAMDGVADVCVIGVEDELAGELPKAYVVRKNGPAASRASAADVLTAPAVLEFVAGHVAPYKKLRLVEFVPSVPRARSGKLLRRLLKSATGRLPPLGGGSEGSGIVAAGVPSRRWVAPVTWESVGGMPEHLRGPKGEVEQTRKAHGVFATEVRLADGEVVTRERRFRQFVNLHRALASDGAACATAVPSLPPKGESDLERRRGALQHWLRHVIGARVLVDGASLPLVLHSAALRTFLGLSLQRLQQAAAGLPDALPAVSQPVSSPGDGAGAAAETAAAAPAPPMDAAALATAAVDAPLARLHGRRGEWATLPPARKLALLKQLKVILARMDHEEWAKESCTAAGTNDAHPSSRIWRATDLIINIATIVSQLDGYIATMQQLAKAASGSGSGALPPMASTAVATAAAAEGGTEVQQHAVRVFPRSFGDKHTNPRAAWSVDVWLEPGKAATRAAFYRAADADDAAADDQPDHGPRRHDGNVGLVLGAGNAGFLSIVDTLHLLFERGMVVLTKHSEVRPYNQQFFEQLFEPLVRAGYVGSLIGGAAIGAALVSDDRIGHVHMTGGAATHDIIVWGNTPEKRAANRAAGTPVLAKPITSELGCVTPYMIAPAQYTTEELAHHARQLAVAFIANNSCNCLAPKLLLLSEGWAQADDFLALLREELGTKPLLPAYYPGTHARYGRIVGEYRKRCNPPAATAAAAAAAAPGPRIETIDAPYPPPEYGDAFGPRLPWTLVELPTSAFEEGADAELLLQTEPFCPILSIGRVPSADATEFLARAPVFCNERVLGSLSCTLVVHPSTEAAVPSAVQGALAALRYGSIGVNTWTGIAYSFAGGSWGAFPGEPLAAVESGIGSVRNTFMLDWPQKTVVRSPFVTSEHAGTQRPLMSERKAIATARFLTTGATWDLMRMLFAA